MQNIEVFELQSTSRTAFCRIPKYRSIKLKNASTKVAKFKVQLPVHIGVFSTTGDFNSGLLATSTIWKRDGKRKLFQKFINLIGTEDENCTTYRQASC